MIYRLPSRFTFNRDRMYSRSFQYLKFRYRFCQEYYRLWWGVWFSDRNSESMRGFRIELHRPQHFSRIQDYEPIEWGKVARPMNLEIRPSWNH